MSTDSGHLYADRRDCAIDLRLPGIARDAFEAKKHGLLDLLGSGDAVAPLFRHTLKYEEIFGRKADKNRLEKLVGV